MNPVFPISSPPKKDGSYLVLAPQSYPKNSRWMVAEFYTDNQMFYSEAGGEHALPDVVAWTELPPEDEAGWLTRQPDMGAVVEALKVHRLEVPRFEDDDNETVVREFVRKDELLAAIKGGVR